MMKDRDIRTIAWDAVKEMFESDLISVDCRVDEYGEKIIDWSKFYMDGDAIEAAAIIYLAAKKVAAALNAKEDETK